MESSRSDDGRLNLTVDVFGDGVVGPQALGSEDPREVCLERVAQSLEGFEAAAPGPRDPRAVQGFRIGTLSAYLVDLLEPLFHPPRSGRLEA